jgi:hypothetical protein
MVEWLTVAAIGSTLGFVVLGVLMLVVLSEISKLDLHQYLQPPRVSDSSISAQIVGLQ